MPHGNYATIHVGISKQQYPHMAALAKQQGLTNQALFRSMLDHWIDPDRDVEVDLALRYVQAILLNDWTSIPTPLRPRAKDVDKLHTLIYGAIRDAKVPF